jgi:hypothetical protein
MIEEFIGPLKASPTTENNDIKNILTTLLVEEYANRDKKQLEGIGANLLGGALNLVTAPLGLLGVKDLGTEIFGRRRPNNTMGLVQLLMQQSGMVEEVALKKEAMKLELEQQKMINNLQKELTMAKIGSEEKLQKNVLDSQTEILAERYKYDEKMAKLNTEEKISLARVEAAIQKNASKYLTDLEIDKALQVMTKQQEFNRETIKSEQYIKLKEMAEARGIKVMELEAQQNMQDKELETRQKEGKLDRDVRYRDIDSREKVANRELTIRSDISEKDRKIQYEGIKSSERIAEARNKSNEAIADKETTSRINAAKSEAEASQRAKAGERAKEGLESRGKIVKAIDGMRSLLAENDDKASVYIENPDFGLRKLLTNMASGTLSKEGSLPQDAIDGIRKFVGTKATEILNAYGNNKERAYEAMSKEINSASSMIKSAIYKVPDIESREIGEIDTALSKLFDTIKSESIEVVDNSYAIENINTTFNLLQSDAEYAYNKRDTLYADPKFLKYPNLVEALKEFKEMKPSSDDPKDYANWIESLILFIPDVKEKTTLQQLLAEIKQK